MKITRLATFLLLPLLAGLLIFSGSAFAVAAQPAFDGARAFAHLEKQCDFGPRVPGTAAHTSAKAYLKKELEKYTDRTQEQNFTAKLGARQVVLTNLIAHFDPACPMELAKTDENAVCRPPLQILVAAHWDSRPTADLDPNLSRRHLPILGANDGASGTAVILELARVLSLAKDRPHGVTLVLFDGEDYGPEADKMFLGSKHFARNYRAAKPNWGLLLDMVGDKDLQITIEGYSRRYAPQVVDRVWNTAEKLGVSAFKRKRGPWVMDDHVPLNQAGIPTANIIDFTYPHWHTLADTPDKCSPDSLQAVGRVVLHLLLEK